jgi:hypothetical protein
MYLSHPVRRMREEPRDGEVTLRVTAESEERADVLAGELEDVGTVEERLRFGALRVTVEQERIGDLCALDGIESVETADTLGVGGDAGEDVEPG